MLERILPAPRAAPSRETLPPVVTVLDPADGTRFSTPSVRVRVNVRSPSGAPVTPTPPSATEVAAVIPG